MRNWLAIHQQRNQILFGTLDADKLFPHLMGRKHENPVDPVDWLPLPRISQQITDRRFICCFRDHISPTNRIRRGGHYNLAILLPCLNVAQKHQHDMFCHFTFLPFISAYHYTVIHGRLPLYCSDIWPEPHETERRLALGPSRFILPFFHTTLTAGSQYRDMA